MHPLAIQQVALAFEIAWAVPVDAPLATRRAFAQISEACGAIVDCLSDEDQSEFSDCVKDAEEQARKIWAGES